MTRPCLKGSQARSLIMIGLMLFVCSTHANEKTVQIAYEESGSPKVQPIPTKGVNPFDPVALNNKAAEKLEQNDYRAALILLDRAVRLAPHHAEIKNNYERLKKWLETSGEAEIVKGEAPNYSPAPSLSAPKSNQQLPPEPPAPWQ